MLAIWRQTGVARFDPGTPSRHPPEKPAGPSRLARQVRMELNPVGAREPRSSWGYLRGGGVSPKYGEERPVCARALWGERCYLLHFGAEAAGVPRLGWVFSGWRWKSFGTRKQIGAFPDAAKLVTLRPLWGLLFLIPSPPPRDRLRCSWGESSREAGEILAVDSPRARVTPSAPDPAAWRTVSLRPFAPSWLRGDSQVSPATLLTPDSVPPPSCPVLPRRVRDALVLPHSCNRVRGKGVPR